MNRKKNNFLILVIFLISFLLRLYFTLIYNEPLYVNDQMNYDYFARALLRDRAFNTIDGRPTAFITPLYPLFLSAIYLLFGYNHLYARIVQALLGSLTCLIIYSIAKELLGRPVALLTFFFMSIHYFFIRHGTHLLSENLFIFWVALSILFLVKFCKRPFFHYAIFFGLFSSLATLTRSAYFLFPFMVISVFWIIPRFLNITYRKLLKYSLTIVLCLIIPVSIWTIRNYLVFKSFIPLGTEAGIVLYSAYNPPGGKLFDSSPEDKVALRSYEMSEVEGSRFLLKQTLLSIKREPSKIYKYIPLKIMYFFSVFDWATFTNSGKAPGMYNFSTAFILPLSFFGIILMFKKKQLYPNFILLFPVIYFLFVTIAIMGVPRTRLPIEPYLIIFAAFFVNYIYIQSRFKLQIVGIISFWYLFNYLLYLNSANVKAIAKTFLQKLGLW